MLVWDDHRLENLRFLCPNCNSQTSTFAGRNNVSEVEKSFCKYCGVETTKKYTQCNKCANEKRRKFFIEKEELAELLWKIPTTKNCKKFGVTDKTVEKTAKKYRLSKPPKGHWQNKKS